MNLDALRQKLQQLQSSTQKQDRLWKPEPGKTTVRIVPYQYNKDNPFIEMFFHYNVGKKSRLSPITYGNPDPIQEFAERLKNTGRSDDWKNGRKLEPVMRTYVPIIVRGKESEGVKYWGFGKNVYQELLSFIADEDYGDITSLKSGRDIVVEFLKAEDAGNAYGKVTIRVKPNTTPATDDKEILDKIMNGQKDLKEIFPEPSYEDLKKVLAEWLELGSDDGSDDSKSVEKESTDDDDEDDTPASKPAAKKSAGGSKKVKDVKSAFDEMFDEN